MWNPYKSKYSSDKEFVHPDLIHNNVFERIFLLQIVGTIFAFPTTAPSLGQRSTIMRQKHPRRMSRVVKKLRFPQDTYIASTSAECSTYVCIHQCAWPFRNQDKKCIAYCSKNLQKIKLTNCSIAPEYTDFNRVSSLQYSLLFTTCSFSQQETGNHYCLGVTVSFTLW